jgi:hypothetical protein
MSEKRNVSSARAKRRAGNRFRHKTRFEEPGLRDWSLGPDPAVREESRRSLCTFFEFWKFCGDKGCMRARACVGDFEGCFDRFWDFVPGDVKVQLRAGLEARAAGKSYAEMCRAIDHAAARWYDLCNRGLLKEPEIEPSTIMTDAKNFPD